MKTSKGFKLVGCLAACGILAGIAIALAPKAVELSSRVGGDSTKSLSITAEQIGAAIGEGTSGNFTVGGLEWHVDNASYADGVATINGGVLYNVTFAGQSVSALGYKGNGFTKAIIKDKVSASGGNLMTKTASDSLIAEHPFGAETSAAFDINFSSDNTAEHKVYRVYIAFGAGGGTSFSSVEFQYTCAEALPEVNLSSPSASASVGDNIQLAWEFANVGGSTPTLTFVSSDPLVASVGEHTGLVTGLSAGTTSITASFEYNATTYYSNAVALEIVSSITYRDIGVVSGSSQKQGAGIFFYFDNSSFKFGTTNEYNSKFTIEMTATNGGNDYPISTTIVNLQMNDSEKIALYFTFADAGIPDAHGSSTTYLVRVSFAYTASDTYQGWIKFTGVNGDPLVDYGGVFHA